MKNGIEDKANMSGKKENDFFDRPEVIKWMLRIFYTCCALLVIADFIVHRHTSIEIEKIYGFYAMYGFVACVLLVLIATQMRKVLMRGEEYYEKNSSATPNDGQGETND